MEPSASIQLRQELESIKEFQRLNAPSRFSYFGYIGELFLGSIIFGELVISRGTDTITVFGIQHFIVWVFLIISLGLIFHALYLIFRFHSDKRIRKILESILSESNNTSDLSAKQNY